jgi:cellulose synthase/poly-beta-1,6-N-acetylglucosamine synthase-like glycosyltransferase
LLAPYQSLFEQFQSLDFQGMIGITAASLHRGMYNLANGANLLYEKAAFLAVDGYKDIDQTPSGDDMLLVYKIAKAYHGSVAFVKNTNAIVATKPMASLDDFLQQRFRWTSKSGHYQDKRITAILGLVYLSVLMIPLNIIVGFFCCPMLIVIAGIQFFSKSVIDYIFLGKMAAWYRREELMKTFWSSQVMHIIYIVGVGTLGNILQYKWKGRKLK